MFERLLKLFAVNCQLSTVNCQLNTDGAGVQTHRYLYGTGVDQILADERGGSVVWALADNLGTVRDVVDGGGVVLNHVTYDSYGRVISQTNPAVEFRFGYTGREQDTETGLDYYRARYYDSGVGRFISEDPIGFGAGDANLYRYVGNSPVNAIDPSGLQEDSPIQRVFGGLLQGLYNFLTRPSSPPIAPPTTPPLVPPPVSPSPSPSTTPLTPTPPRRPNPRTTPSPTTQRSPSPSPTTVPPKPNCCDDDKKTCAKDYPSYSTLDQLRIALNQTIGGFKVQSDYDAKTDLENIRKNHTNPAYRVRQVQGEWKLDSKLILKGEKYLTEAPKYGCKDPKKGKDQEPKHWNAITALSNGSANPISGGSIGFCMACIDLPTGAKIVKTHAVLNVKDRNGNNKIWTR
jgi:RHS repeat-associated protein